MTSDALTLSPAAPAAPSAIGVARLVLDGKSEYRLRHRDGRWLIYRHERVIGDFPAEHAAIALDYLGQKQSERSAYS